MDEMEKPVIGPEKSNDGSRADNISAWAVALSLLVAAPLPALAGSNLSGGYPEHQCGERPVPPERPEEFRTRAELDAYNEQVHEFNASMEQYVDCLQTYVDNAAADIRTIREKLESALDAVKP